MINAWLFWTIFGLYWVLFAASQYTNYLNRKTIMIQQITIKLWSKQPMTEREKEFFSKLIAKTAKQASRKEAKKWQVK